MFQKILIIFLINFEVFQQIDCKSLQLVSIEFCNSVEPSVITIQSSIGYKEKSMNATVIVGEDLDNNQVEAVLEYARTKDSHSYIKIWQIITTLCELLENETGDTWIDLSQNYGNFSCPVNRGRYELENFPTDFASDRSLFVGFYKLTLLTMYDIDTNSEICLELIFEVLE